MTAVLPSLVLTLLCLMRAGAEVPVQLDFDTKKSLCCEAVGIYVQPDQRWTTVLALLQEYNKNPGDGSLQFTGMWHIVAAVSNCPVFLSMKDKVTSSAAAISFTPEGHMTMETVIPLPEECKKIKKLFQRSGQAGHYVGTEKGEERDLRVMDTDYKHYAIVYTQQEGSQEPSTMLQLYTRNQDTSPQLLQKFKQLFHSVGLTEDMLVMLPHSDRCTETHK